MGALASNAPRDGGCRAGVLVEKGFNYTLLDVDDLHEFTGITPVVVEQQLRVPYSSAFGLLQYHLEQMFGDLPLTKETSNSGTAHILRVYDAVDVVHSSWKAGVEIEWEGNALNDMVADSVVAVVLNIESSPASVKLTQGACDGHSHSHSHSHSPSPSSKHDGKPGAAELAPMRSSHAADISAKLALFMKQQFTHVELDAAQQKLVVRLNELSASVSTATLDIETDSPLLQTRIAAIVARVQHTMRPLTHNSAPLPEQQQQSLDLDADADADKKGIPLAETVKPQQEGDNDDDEAHESSAVASSSDSEIE
ncbi:endoribonuclease ysh1, partial [Coemansia erecta]